MGPGLWEGGSVTERVLEWLRGRTLYEKAVVAVFGGTCVVVPVSAVNGQSLIRLAVWYVPFVLVVAGLLRLWWAVRQEDGSSPDQPQDVS